MKDDTKRLTMKIPDDKWVIEMYTKDKASISFKSFCICCMIKTFGFITSASVDYITKVLYMSVHTYYNCIEELKKLGIIDVHYEWDKDTGIKIRTIKLLAPISIEPDPEQYWFYDSKIAELFYKYELRPTTELVALVSHISTFSKKNKPCLLTYKQIANLFGIKEGSVGDKLKPLVNAGIITKRVRLNTTEYYVPDCISK